MGWRDLLETGDERVTLPWTGGRSLHSKTRTFKINGRLPREHGWFSFKLKGTKATDPQPAEPLDLLESPVFGYLVGDHVVPDDTRVDPDPQKILDYSEKVYLLPEELDRFSRVRAGRVYPEGPLIFIEQTFPFGPEDEVMNAFLDGQSIAEIREVTPALHAAYNMEVYQKELAEARRIELARIRAEEEAARAAEARRKELLEQLGDGAVRRELARQNFPEAARAALAVGGAEFLDSRKGRRNEFVVKYRVDGQRLECVCDANLQIIDAGVCLVDHTTNEKGDTYFTLESLPAVIRQAIREHKLVVWRHV
jgi:hypothetical protein